MHAQRLKRIADETGGRFYTPDTIAGMPEDLRYTGRGVTTVEERELWHMPIVLFVLLGLIFSGMGVSPRSGDGLSAPAAFPRSVLTSGVSPRRQLRRQFTLP
jgi:hypothetical protein